MKYILIAFFAMAINSAKGQDWIPLSGGSGTVNTVTQREYDTVRVVMLVSDTTRKYAGMQTYYYEGGTRWQFGYSVREKHNTDSDGGIDPYMQEGYVSRDYYTHLFYLDDKKQPIKQTLIIWQSIEAKP